MNARDSLFVALPAALVGAGLGYFFASVGESGPGRSEASSPSATAKQRTVAPALENALAAPSTQAARTVAEPVVETAPLVREAVALFNNR